MKKPIVRFVRVSSHYRKVNGKRKRIRGYIEKRCYQKVPNPQTGSSYLVRIPDPEKKRFKRIHFYVRRKGSKKRKRVYFIRSRVRSLILMFMKYKKTRLDPMAGR